jgi:hypothetical protein
MMIRKSLCGVMLLAIGIVNAQQQNIELPDFVITGRQSADVQAAQKSKPELISILSKEFFTPEYSPEELPILISSDPVTILPDVKTSDESFSGNLKVKIGKYSLPVGELNISQSYENYLFNAKLWGVNTTEYIPNSGYNNSGFKMTHDFYTSTRSEFIPGSKISVDAAYWRDSYKMFGTLNPAQIRESNNGSANVLFSNNYSRAINVNFGLGGDLLSLSENSVRELNLKGNGLIEVEFNQFRIGGKAQYKMQQFQSDLFSTNNFYSFVGEGFFKTSPTNSILIKGGVVYETNSEDGFISPFASAEIQLDKGFILGTEYKPHTEFLTARNFLTENLYSAIVATPNCFMKFNNDITASIRYEFQRLFLVNFALNYSRVDNFVYYQDFTSRGVFDIRTMNDVDIFKSKLELQYHPGILGSFYGEFIFQNVKDTDDRFIPYQPQLSSVVSYSYNFDFGLGIKLNYDFAIGIYSDRLNVDMLDDYQNISASISFEVFKGIKITGDFQNILNRSNFVWKYYQRKPFDYLVGIDYRW